MSLKLLSIRLKYFPRQISMEDKRKAQKMGNIDLKIRIFTTYDKTKH